MPQVEHRKRWNGSVIGSNLNRSRFFRYKVALGDGFFSSDIKGRFFCLSSFSVNSLSCRIDPWNLKLRAAFSIKSFYSIFLQTGQRRRTWRSTLTRKSHLGVAWLTFQLRLKRSVEITNLRRLIYQRAARSRHGSPSTSPSVITDDKARNHTPKSRTKDSRWTEKRVENVRTLDKAP